MNLINKNISRKQINCIFRNAYYWKVTSLGLFRTDIKFYVSCLQNHGNPKIFHTQAPWMLLPHQFSWKWWQLAKIKPSSINNTWVKKLQNNHLYSKMCIYGKYCIFSSENSKVIVTYNHECYIWTDELTSILFTCIMQFGVLVNLRQYFVSFDE